MTACFATTTTHPVIQKNIRITKVFTKLMKEGNVRATVCWITERSGGGVLHPSDTATLSGTDLLFLFLMFYVKASRASVPA